jgi:NADPH-dependent curcumin reductase CurA
MAGSEEKCRLVEKLGAQVCLNYKSKDLSKQLKEVCSNGIDVYFDNVGGEILDTVLQYINDGCRIVMCGAIS